jgi:hypothetical protein
LLFRRGNLIRCIMYNHRNLRSRTSMLAQALQIFWGKETPCKKLADLHPRQGNLLEKEHFYRAQ